MNLACFRPGAFLIALAVLGGADCQPTGPSKPAGHPVVFFQSPSVQGWQAVDWTGRVQRPIGSDRVGIPYQSPDGSRLIWSPEGEWQFVDWTGKTVSQLDLSRARSFTWADDASGMCVARDDASTRGSYQLDFETTAGVSRSVTSFHAASRPNIVACSPRAGRIVIATAQRNNSAAVQVTFDQIIVVDIKTGSAQTSRIANIAMDVNALVVSHDGTEGALATSTETTILNLLTGSSIRQLPGVTPLAFSWDARLVALATSTNRGELESVSTGQVIWSDDVSKRVTQAAIPDPASPSVMLVTTSGALDDLVVISPSGAARTIAKGVFPAQTTPCSICSAI